MCVTVVGYVLAYSGARKSTAVMLPTFQMAARDIGEWICKLFNYLKHHIKGAIADGALHVAQDVNLSPQVYGNSVWLVRSKEKRSVSLKQLGARQLLGWRDDEGNSYAGIDLTTISPSGTELRIDPMKRSAKANRISS